MRRFIEYTTLNTWLGTVLVGLNEDGLCVVTIGSDRESLIADLKTRLRPDVEAFPGGKARPEHMLVHQLIDGERDYYPGPLDMQGTPMQIAIWEKICEIRSGSTASYADIAKAIGKPKAYRAVANACNANLLALVVPCHRVIASTGELSGYRWGVELKRQILASEAARKEKLFAELSEQSRIARESAEVKIRKMEQDFDPYVVVR